MKKIIGYVLAAVAGAIVLTVGIAEYRVQAADCGRLATDIKVFEACYPQIGCMSSFTEVVDLNRRMEVCAVASEIR